MIPQQPKLLTRDQFRTQCFERDKHKCVVCGQPATECHHLLERRLHHDGGYYMSNGVSLCNPCHRKAEQTLISCEELRSLAGITEILLPEHLYPDCRYDKWANVIQPNGTRLKGELFWDESVQKILEPVLDQFTRLVKAPRTLHLPWSPGCTSDDKILPTLEHLVGREVVVTIKKDGENTSIYGKNGYCHARSVAPMDSHPSRNRIKALASLVGPELPEDWRVCGENVFAKHSIHYTNIRPHKNWYFQLFNVWNEKNICLSWDEVEEWSELLEVPTVPVIYRGLFDEVKIKALYQERFEGDLMEGYVVRPVEGFPLSAYRKVVGKFVRKGHVVSSHHWKYDAMVQNQCRATS